MSDHSPVLAQSDVSAPDADARVRALMERQLAVLGHLAEVGLNIARAVERQTDGTGDAVVQDVAMAYARVARAVRLTILLQSKAIGDLRQFDHFHPLGPAPAEDARRQLEAARKSSVERIVARVIDGAFDDEGQADYVDQLANEVSERLDDEDFCDVLARPISEIVSMICGDLGLSPDWPRLAEEAWAQAEIRSGQPGSPLAAVIAQGAQTQPPTSAPDPCRLMPQVASP